MEADLSDKLLARWRQGDQQAADELFRRYAGRLTALARARLSVKLSQRLDPEDVVQSAYRSFFAGARAGRYDLEHGGDLWRLLVAITLHKLHHQVQRNTAGKRSVDREYALDRDDPLRSIPQDLLTAEPSPVEAVMLADEMEQIMRQLPAEERPVLELRLQGYTLYEIADQTHCCRRTVCRVLDRIKQQLVDRGVASADS